jgi:hypothetical protein
VLYRASGLVLWREAASDRRSLERNPEAELR